MHCTKALTLPDSRCKGARAHTRPTLEPQKPWRHAPWRTKSTDLPAAATLPPGHTINISNTGSVAAPPLRHHKRQNSKLLQADPTPSYGSHIFRYCAESSSHPPHAALESEK
eukprot:scaffold3284_cov67-Cyclotella_meneghiniana.AAC.7